MKKFALISSLILWVLSACTASPTLQPAASATRLAASATPRIQIQPSWTPTVLTPPTYTPEPRRSSTPAPTATSPKGVPALVPPPVAHIRELLVDRPTHSSLLKPASLVSMAYDPTSWSLGSAYPTTFMGYALTSRSMYGCSLAPVVEPATEGFQVEKFDRPLGATSFEISRMSQNGVLASTAYCTGEGEQRSCYQVSLGTDHEACLKAAEEVLAGYQLITNPFFDQVPSSKTHWTCTDASGAPGLCAISYSIPLNTLAFTNDGGAWAGGDDGVLYQHLGSQWVKAASPASHPIYDLAFSSPQDGWAVGAGAQVLHWDGTAWSEVLPYHAPGEGPAGSTQVLYAVEVRSNKDAWMAGAMTGIDGKTQPYLLHWDGEQLVEPAALPDCICGLNALLSLGVNDLYAVGGSDLGAVSFHWDGSAWSKLPIQGADTLYTLVQSYDGSLWTAGIEVARDRSDTRGAVFYWDGSSWQRVAVPPLTGGIYALALRGNDQLVLGGDFSAMRDAAGWQPVVTDIAGYGWIVDIAADLRGDLWALTRSGNIFKLVTSR